LSRYILIFGEKQQYYGETTPKILFVLRISANIEVGALFTHFYVLQFKKQR